MTLSKNGTGLLVLALSLFGVQVSEIDLVDTMGAIGQIVAFALMLWNQFSRPDVVGFFFKR